MPPPDPRRRAVVNGLIGLAGLALGAALVLFVVIVNHRHVGSVLGYPWALFFVFWQLPTKRWLDRAQGYSAGYSFDPKEPRDIAVAAGPDPYFVVPARHAAGILCGALWLATGWACAVGIGHAWSGATPPSLSRILVHQVFAAAFASTALYVTVILLLGRPDIRLYPDRVELRGYLVTQVVPWEAFSTNLTPWTSVPLGAYLRSEFLWFPIARPELVTGGRPSTRRLFGVPYRGLAVASKYLADAIIEYITHPEYRAGIGTEPEARRFREQRAQRVAAHPLPAAAN